MISNEMLKAPHFSKKVKKRREMMYTNMNSHLGDSATSVLSLHWKTKPNVFIQKNTLKILILI